jgi:hypothetical protein
MFLINQNGLQQLRDLEEIKRGDRVVWASVFAILISVISFAVAQGWIKFN